MPSPTVVFDLDGTLVDSAPDLIDTLNVILARHDVAPVDFDEARSMIGAGVKPLLQRGLVSRGVQLPPEQIDRLFAEYLEVYAAHIADRSRPFPGLEQALDALAALAGSAANVDAIHVDLADLRGYHYYTGATFSVFAQTEHGTIIDCGRGGRYEAAASTSTLGTSPHSSSRR